MTILEYTNIITRAHLEFFSTTGKALGRCKSIIKGHHLRQGGRDIREFGGHIYRRLLEDRGLSTSSPPPSRFSPALQGFTTKRLTQLINRFSGSLLRTRPLKEIYIEVSTRFFYKKPFYKKLILGSAKF